MEKENNLEKNIDKYKVVVIEDNVPNGKYIVVQTKEDSYLFMAVKIIGGHSDIFGMFEITQMSSREDKQSLNRGREYYFRKFRGRDKLIEALKKIPQFPEIKKVIGGGQYHFHNNLELYSKSQEYGKVENEILEKFREPIKQFCKKENIHLESLVIE